MGEAIEQHRRAIAMRPDCARAHRNLGVALRSQGLLDEAIEQFETAVRIRLDFVAAQRSLAEAQPMRTRQPGP